MKIPVWQTESAEQAAAKTPAPAAAALGLVTSIPFAAAGLVYSSSAADPAIPSALKIGIVAPMTAMVSTIIAPSEAYEPRKTESHPESMTACTAAWKSVVVSSYPDCRQTLSAPRLAATASARPDPYAFVM